MKRLVIVIFIIFASFLTFSLYRTFAYDTSIVEETPSTTDLEYTFKIGNSSIKQITVDSGETKYYDVVLGNPNPAKISYSIYYEMVSPTTKPDNFKIEYTSKSTGDSTGKVDKEGNITLNLVVTNTGSSTVTIKIGSVAGYVNGGELILESGQEFISKKVTGADFIKNLNDGSTGDSGSGVYKIHHDAISAENSATGKDIKATDDYRYYGADPNNYICLDNSTDTCEDRHLYRIIGSIYEELEGDYRLKVTKATPLTDGTNTSWTYDCYINSSSTKSMSYVIPLAGDRSVCSNYSGRFIKSDRYSTLALLLNGSWINSQTGPYTNYIYGAQTVNFENYGPSETAKSFINNSIFFLNAYRGLDYSNFYLKERSGSNGYLDIWNGKIGLIYVSDYVLAGGSECLQKKADNYYYLSKCDNNDWLMKYGWTMSGDDTGSTNMVTQSNYSDGRVFHDFEPAYPTFYLTSSTLITGGTGTLSDPYQIGL